MRKVNVCASLFVKRVMRHIAATYSHVAEDIPSGISRETVWDC